MRKTFSEQLYSEMKSNQDIFLIVGDVGYGVFDKFKEDFPCLLYTSPSPRD